MKRALAVASLLVFLGTPAMASPRDDDPRGKEGVVKRVLVMIKRLVGGVMPFDDPIGPLPPKP